jgi:hypothetical protein
MRMRVVGIDGCRKGWVGIIVDDGCVEALFAHQIAELVARADLPGMSPGGCVTISAVLT